MAFTEANRVYDLSQFADVLPRFQRLYRDIGLLPDTPTELAMVRGLRDALFSPFTV